MNSQWIVYALLVGALLCSAALVAEQSLRLKPRGARMVWLLAMLLTVGLPLWSLVRTEAPAPPTATVSTTPVIAARVLPSLTATGLASAGWLPGQRSTPIDATAWLNKAWLLASVLAAAGWLAAALALQRRRRSWREGVCANVPVLVAPDAGPAVVGVLRPRIVLPGWLLAAPSDRQALVLAHEQSHLAARDPLLLAAAMLLLVAMPWNLPLWFELRRLRQAIEADCDGRVLDTGVRLADYGAVLLDLGAHQGASSVYALGAGSFLERRLRLMTRRPARWHRFAAPLLLLLAIDIGTAAARVSAPPAPLTATAPAADRAALAGYYQVGPHRVAVVSVSGDGLTMKINVERQLALLPAAGAADLYFVPDSDVAVQFDRHAGMLVLRSNGVDGDPARRVEGAAVEAADTWVAARVASQSALPAGAGILERNLQARSFGELRQDDFTPEFLRMAEPLMARHVQRVAQYGAVQEIRFTGVNR